MRTPFVLLLLLTAVLSPFALAQDGDDDAPGDDDRGRAEDALGGSRKVRIDVEDQKATIKLEREEGGAEDEVKVVLDAPEASMKVEYGTKNATAKTETELKVRLREVVEYADDDSDGAYTPGADRVVARHLPSQMRWTVTAPTAVADASGKAGQRIVGTGVFPGGNGSVSFVLSVYGDFATVNGTSLRPSDVKIDVLLDGFPYRENGTAAALLFKTEREAKAQLRNDGEDRRMRGVQAVSGTFAAYFTWADVAMVDGVEKPVHTTPVSNSTGAGGAKVKDSFWLSYPRGQHVNHDPVLGVASAGEPAVRADTPAPGVLVVAAVASVAALVLARRRRA